MPKGNRGGEKRATTNLKEWGVLTNLKDWGVYKKLESRYKGNNFAEGRTLEQLVKNNKYLNKNIEDVRNDYQEISNKLMQENNYTEPENRDYKQIRKDRLLRDKIDFALSYLIYKDRPELR